MFPQHKRQTWAQERPIGDAIRDFLWAIDDLDFLTRVECSKAVVAGYWKRITKAVSAVRNTARTTLKDAHEWHASELRAILGDVLRIHEIFRVECEPPELWQQVYDNWEFHLLTRSAWRFLGGRLPDGLDFDGAYWEILKLRETILAIVGYAVKLSEVAGWGIPAKRIRRTESLVFDAYAEQHAKTQFLLAANVDRWIYPRLGTNPDQWTTGLNRVLLRLRKLFSTRDSAEGYISKPPSAGEVETILCLCGQLEEREDELASLRFDSVAVVGNATGQESGLRVKADPENKTVYLDGKAFPVRSRITAVYLQAVIESGEKPISGTQINERYSEFPADKVTRYRERLPTEIQELIDASQGSGSCLKPEAWKKSQS